MTNVVALPGTANSSLGQENRPEPACDRALGFLGGERLVYATNLVRDWEAQLIYLDGLKGNSAKSFADNTFRLLNHSQAAPWEIKPTHVTSFLEARAKLRPGGIMSPATVGAYCAAWRSFQNFMLELDRVNEIVARFQTRPRKFVTDENSIAVKKYKSHWVPKAWALSPEEIDAIDAQFAADIQQAHAGRSKSLLPLQRDRVMFHLDIHFALRVSELVSVELTAFHRSHDPKLAHFGDFGTLTVTGKNNVTGTIPMREPQVHALLEWYLSTVRQKLLLRRKDGGNGLCTFEGKTYVTAQLLFPSERGGVICPQAFRKRLKAIAMRAGVIRKKLTPHVLRHTGCTLMVPVYSPEIAQKYMRHKNLFTTLYYYHPSPLNAAHEVNSAVALFGDDED
jgi:site-specific recombinase XerD